MINSDKPSDVEDDEQDTVIRVDFTPKPLKPFQASWQQTALRVHAVLVKTAPFLWTPVRWCFERVNGTAELRKFNAEN